MLLLLFWSCYKWVSHSQGVTLKENNKYLLTNSLIHDPECSVPKSCCYWTYLQKWTISQYKACVCARYQWFCTQHNLPISSSLLVTHPLPFAFFCGWDCTRIYFNIQNIRPKQCINYRVVLVSHLCVKAARPLSAWEEFERSRANGYEGTRVFSKASESGISAQCRSRICICFGSG